MSTRFSPLILASLLTVMLTACGGGGAGSDKSGVITPDPLPTVTPSPTVTQSLPPNTGATVTLPASGAFTAMSVTFPASNNLPSGVSVTFDASSSITPPAALSVRRKQSATAPAYWEMTFSGSTLANVVFDNSITATLPATAGVTGTNLVLEVFDGANLAANCPPAATAAGTVYTCANLKINLADTYYLELVAGSNLTAASNCIVPIAASPAGPHLLYYTDAGNDAVDSFDVCAQPASGVTATFALPPGTAAPTAQGEIRFDRASAASDPRVFVLGVNNTLVYLDVTTAPGTVLQTVDLPQTPHHIAGTSPGTTPEILYVTMGNGTLATYTVSQTAPYLTAGPALTALSSPRGAGLEGVSNDMFVANFGDGTVDAIDRSKLVVDSSVNLSTASTTAQPQGVSGPNAAANCALVMSAGTNTVSALSIVAPGGTATMIGTPIALPSVGLQLSYFPPGTPGSGSPGYGGNVAMVVSAGAAQLVTCDGTAFNAGPLWTTLPSTPTGIAPSNYTSTAVDSLIYVVGTNSGTPVLQGYAATSSTPAFTVNPASGVLPQDVTAGP